MLQSFSRGGTCKSFYPTLASEKVLCCWLKRFLFFKSRCFFSSSLRCHQVLLWKAIWKIAPLTHNRYTKYKSNHRQNRFLLCGQNCVYNKIDRKWQAGPGFILCRHRGLSRLQSMPLSSNIYRCIKWIWLVSTGFASNIKVSQDLGVKTFQISRPRSVRCPKFFDGSKYKRLNNLYLVKLSIRYACAVLMAILFRF